MAGPRIGIDVTAALSQGGGIGRYTRELIRALVELDSHNQYTLFSARPPAHLPVADPLPKGPRVVHKAAPISERWLYRLWYRFRLPLPVQWRTGPLDLFHSPDFVLPPVSGGIPSLLTVHDLSFVHYPETFPSVLVNYLNRVVPWSVRRATHILADSEATRADLLSLWKVPAEKVTVLYSGVSGRFQPASPEEITAVRERYHLGERPYVLAVGTVQPRKNYQMLVRAFRQVSECFPHTLVLAGGKGWLDEGLITEVQEQDLTERVRLPGFVDDEHLPALYSGAALYVFPSLYEGFGLPVLEAMACGVPVLIADASSLPEVGGEAAIRISPADEQAWTAAMTALLDEPARRAQLVEAGFAQARLFTWQGAASQLLEVYSGLLA